MPQAYLIAVKSALASSFTIASFDVLEEWVQPDRGYIRVRANLQSGDFLEASEYFTLQANRHTTVRYRYQWMNGAKTVLRRRWDNVPHHPNMLNFPHHIHLANGDVIPGQSLSILELLEILESE
jgi:hypothetical protein